MYSHTRNIHFTNEHTLSLEAVQVSHVILPSIFFKYWTFSLSLVLSYLKFYALCSYFNMIGIPLTFFASESLILLSLFSMLLISFIVSVTNCLDFSNFVMWEETQICTNESQIRFKYGYFIWSLKCVLQNSNRRCIFFSSSFITE